ncbi:unnamed protein product, partial [Ectocarpus sp. 13 AM-2016]
PFASLSFKAATVGDVPPRNEQARLIRACARAPTLCFCCAPPCRLISRVIDLAPLNTISSSVYFPVPLRFRPPSKTIPHVHGEQTRESFTSLLTLTELCLIKFYNLTAHFTNRKKRGHAVRRKKHIITNEI